MSKKSKLTDLDCEEHESFKDIEIEVTDGGVSVTANMAFQLDLPDHVIAGGYIDQQSVYTLLAEYLTRHADEVAQVAARKIILQDKGVFEDVRSRFAEAQERAKKGL